MELSLDYSYDFINFVHQDATDSFFTLDEEIRKCQEEPKDDCSTRKYLEDLKNKCQCLPFQLRSLIDEDIGSIYKVLSIWAISFFRNNPNNPNPLVADADLALSRTDWFKVKI